jgi:hypothetical protein
MAEYQIKFFKNLVSSDGHPFKVLQRVISVSHSQNCEDAVRIAQQRFEGLENVGDWRLHADFCEACADSQAPQQNNAA